MRGCAEALEVQLDAGGRPVIFRRRGRAYRVTAYLQQWQERTSWWLQSGAVADLRLEDPVWRVEAICGPRRGVFELRDSASAWTLVGILD